jgi:signal transduction histidine kinase
MKVRRHQRYLEQGLVAVMAIVSIVLVLIQYNWTGRISRSEAERLRANVREQLRQINRSWTAELTESWRTMRPSAEEIALSARDAYAARYRQWLAHDNPPLFSRVGIEMDTGDSRRLLAIDPASGRFESWTPSGAGTLARFEMPGESPREWMVFELNQDYLQRTWLPGLIHRWISPEYDLHVRIRTNEKEWRTIYKSPGSAGAMGAPLAAAGMFSTRGSRAVKPGESEERWIIEAWNRSGSLEAGIAASRWRNFGIAAVLIALILSAGCALLHYTARSRWLAETQLMFVAGVSHEMRTPLAVIRGAGQNLAGGVVQDLEHVRQYARMIVQHADQLGDTIEQVLMFAAAQGRETHAADTVSVGAIIEEAAQAASPDLHAAGCELRLQIPPDLPEILGDAVDLRRAFQNLITNAARHGGAGGWVRISAAAIEVEGRQIVEVRVADGGRGIPETELSRIFEPFYRGERARSEQVRGAGLGLSLVQEIAQAHGGSVEARSERGGGAEFSVRLPVVFGISDGRANSHN